MKKSIRIGVALILAMGIVLGAFYLNQKNKEMPVQEKATKATDVTAKLAVSDSDGDGIPDWEEELRRRAFEQITTPTSTTGRTGTTSEYTPPSTFTGQFTEAFMEDYLQGKIEGVDYSNPQPLVEKALNTIESNIESKKYSRGQLTLIPSTQESIRTYGNEVAIIVQKHSLNNSDHELDIVGDALQLNDPSRLEDLSPLIFSYQNMLADLLTVEVPDAFALEHIQFLNTLQSIVDSLIAMQDIFNDPLYGLARINMYTNITLGISEYFKNSADIMTENGVVFTSDEAGSFFYIFDAV